MADALYDGVIGAVAVKQIRRTSVSPSIEWIAARQSGAVGPSAHYLNRGRPQAVFESMDVDGIIDGIGATGLLVTSGTLTVPWNRRANGSTFAGGSNNFVISGTDGFAVIRRISATQNGGGAVAEVDLGFLSTDGITVPLTDSVNQALASQAYNVSYDLGPVSVNASEVPDVVGTVVNTGLGLQFEWTGGGVWPTAVYLTQSDPSIDITFRDFDAMDGFINGAVMTAASVFYRKRSAGGTYVADGTAEHVKASFTDGVADVQDVTGSGNESGTATLRLLGQSLTLSTTSTISV